jgi:hypothetical protein
VFYDSNSYDHWQRVAWNPCRHLCLQGLQFPSGEPQLAPLKLTNKRAVDSRMFGANTLAYPSHRGFVDVEMMKEFYRIHLAAKLFDRMKDSPGWKTAEAGFEVKIPAPMFAAVVEPLGAASKQAAHILVTVSIRLILWRLD